MRWVRLVFWLGLLPALLLTLALRMNTHFVEVSTGALEEREREQHNEKMLAQAEEQTRIYLQERNAKRQALAEDCARRAGRSFGDRYSGASPALIFVSHRGCGKNCDTEKTAARLADEYHYKGLGVMVIRTRDDDVSARQGGVDTVIIPDCNPLASGYGDDYFFRHASGAISSSKGDGAGRTGMDAFEPEDFLREKLGLRPL